MGHRQATPGVRVGGIRHRRSPEVVDGGRDLAIVESVEASR